MMPMTQNPAPASDPALETPALTLPSIPIETITSVNGLMSELSHLDIPFVQIGVDWGIRLLAAILILIAGWTIGNWIDRRFEKMGKIDPTLRNFIGGFLKYTILIVSVITVIGLFGIPMASLLAVLGAAGLAIGLALQGTLSNVSAGVMLLILRPFNVGDYITFGLEGGTVKALGLFGTELAMADNVYVFAPNSKIWGSEIRNYSRNPLRRQDIPVSISYKDDINQVFEIINTVLKNDVRILKAPEDKEPQVMVEKMGDFSIILTARFWSSTSDYWTLRWDITKALKEALDKEGITAPLTMPSLPTAMR
jgi:small conductance mechanosensitive channel